MSFKSFTYILFAIAGIIVIVYIAQTLISSGVLSEPSSDEENIEVSEVQMRRTIVSAPKGLIDTMIAETDEQRIKGLGGRKILGEEEGMLFPFVESAIQGFWMKDMNFPIDIIWLDEDKTVVGIEKEVSPDTYPEIFYSPSEIKYVLELNSGASDRYGIASGTKLVFEAY